MRETARLAHRNIQQRTFSLTKSISGRRPAPLWMGVVVLLRTIHYKKVARRLLSTSLVPILAIVAESKLKLGQIVLAITS